jgi:hypothetical protein
MDNASHVIIPLLTAAKRKLAFGKRIRLEMAIGSVKMKSERPFESSSGVSADIKIMVSSIRNNSAAQRPDHRLLIW